MRLQQTDSRCDIMKLPKFKKKSEEEKVEESEIEVLEPYPESGQEEPKEKKVKSDKPKKPILQRILDWYWGAGPPGKYYCEDNPHSPYCLRAKLKRWYYVNYRGFAYYITTMYDRPNDEYIWDFDIVPRKEIPKKATLVTNQKNTWHMDLDHPDRDFIYMEGDYGFTAHDADLYIKCNKINEAMKIDLDAKSTNDTTKMILIMACIGVAVMVFYMMFMQR